MTLQLAPVLRSAAVVALLAAWAVLAHRGSAGEGDADLGAALGIAPLIVIVALLLWRVRNPLWLIGGGLATLAALVAAWPTLRENVPLLYLVQHIATNLALATLFGRTLFGGGDALVTQLARAVHGKISERKVRYTRAVTVAWTAFFIGISLTSLLLFSFAPAHVWSVFANLLSTPLLALMFAGELVCRYTLLPPEERTGIVDSIRAYRLNMRQRQSTTLADPS